MSIREKKGSALGFWAGELLSIFGKSPTKPNTTDLQRIEFKTSTQRLGLRFTERIRQVFRLKWLKKF